MASQAWLESSLRRSASLGLEVLERASRRSVDWSSTGASETPTTDEDTQIPVRVPACSLYINPTISYIWILTPFLCLIAVFIFQRAHSERDDVFATIAAFMEQTTYQCKVSDY